MRGGNPEMDFDRFSEWIFVRLSWPNELIVTDYLAFIPSFNTYKCALINVYSSRYPNWWFKYRIKDAIITSVSWVCCLYNFKLFGNIVCEWLHIQCTNSHLLNRALFITLYLSPIESFIPPPEINTVLKFVFFKLLLFLIVSVISLCSHKNGVYSSRFFFFLTLHE